MSWILDSFKAMLFVAAACMAIININNGVLMLWLILTFVAVIQWAILAFDTDNSIEKIRLGVYSVELLLIFGAIFFFYKNFIFNSVMMLWIIPLAVRYFLPNIFHFYSKKRNT